jgi:hypothetical protein
MGMRGSAALMSNRARGRLVTSASRCWHLLAFHRISAIGKAQLRTMATTNMTMIDGWEK